MKDFPFGSLAVFLESFDVVCLCPIGRLWVRIGAFRNGFQSCCCFRVLTAWGILDCCLEWSIEVDVCGLVTFLFRDRGKDASADSSTRQTRRSLFCTERLQFCETSSETNKGGQGEAVRLEGSRSWILRAGLSIALLPPRGPLPETDSERFPRRRADCGVVSLSS